MQGIADRTESSAPLVQLAGLELERNQLDAAAAVIAKIRARWTEAATSDVLSAQLELKRGHTAAGDRALRCRPQERPQQQDRPVLESSARRPDRVGRRSGRKRSKPSSATSRSRSSIRARRSLPAAQSALANLSLRTGAFDDAIRRFEELKRSDQKGTLSRSDRWQLITAYVATGQWPLAKREIAAILNDTKNPPSDDERVRGANLYRQQGEDAPALSQLDYVLDVNPDPPLGRRDPFLHPAQGQSSPIRPPRS